MKKNFMTRVLAVALSAAMALSMATATNLTVAEAASKPAMKTSSFKVRIGNKAKNYYASAATQKAYKIVKAKAGNTDKATAKVVKSGKAVAITAGSKTGKTTIKLTFKNKKTAAKTTIKFAGKVLAAKVAEQAIKEVKQTAIDTIEVTFATAPASVAATNFTVEKVNETIANQSLVVKSAKADENDAAKVTVVVYGSITDSATYAVSYTADEKTVTKQFTATDGVVASIDVTPKTITAGKDTVLYYSTFDANGILLDKQKYDAGTDAKVELTYSVTSGTGYITGSKAYLAAVGDSLEVTATYHTYKYEGVEEVGAVVNKITIAAVENAATITSVPYTITEKAVWNWDNLSPVTTVAMNDENSYLRMNLKTDQGTYITSDDEYTVESSDTSVFVVSGDAAVDNLVTPTGVGTAYAIIKNASGKVVYSLPVQVVAARQVAKIILNKSKIVVSTHAAVTHASDSVTAFCYDQYGALYNDVDVTVTLKSMPSSEETKKTDKSTVAQAMLTTTSYTGYVGTLGVSTNDLSAYATGNYTYLVTATDKGTGATRSNSFVVETRAPKASGDSFAIRLTTNTVPGTAGMTHGYAVESGDCGYGNEALNPFPVSEIKAHLVRMNNGIVKGAEDDAMDSGLVAATVGGVTLKKNGVVIAQTGVAFTKAKTCAAVSEATANTNFGTEVNKLNPSDVDDDIMTVNVSETKNGYVHKLLEPATYTFEAVVYSVDSNSNVTKTTVSKVFKLTDSQPATKVQVLKTAVDAAGIDDEDSAIFVYSYNGVDLVDKDGAVDGTWMNGAFTKEDTTEMGNHITDTSVYAKSTTPAKNTYVVNKLFVKLTIPKADVTGFTAGSKVLVPVDLNRSFTNYTGDNKTSWKIS